MSIDTDLNEPLTPTHDATTGQVQQKFSELVQAIKVAASRRTDKSGVTVRTHKTAPLKLHSNKPFGIPDFLRRIRSRQKPDMARLVRELSPVPPVQQLRASRSTDELNNGSIRIGRGSIRVHEYRQHNPLFREDYICCICGRMLEATAVRLYNSRFCEEDFSRFYLQRNVREHFLVPVLQETYLPGLGQQGPLPQVNLKGLDMKSVKVALNFFRLLDDDEDGWIWRHQLSSLLIRILMKQLGDERQSKNILNSSPYKTMTSGMGLEKRGRVHEIEFLACFAFCVREYLDMITVFQKRVKSRVPTNRNPFYTADDDDMELPDHLANRSSYHNPLSELESSLNSSHDQPRVRMRSGHSQAMKSRVSRGDSEEASEGWMMY